LDGFIKWLKIGAVVLSLIFIAYIVVAFMFPTVREALRDIAIVILAVLQMIAVALAVALLMAILYAVRYIHKATQETVMPEITKINTKLDELLDNTRAIVGNVRESSDTITTTTIYTAERVVTPIIRVSGLVAGVRAAASALARRDVQAEELSAMEVGRE
jgi:phage-related protein